MTDRASTSKPLLVATTIYGVLYLILFLDSFGTGQMISSDPNFDPWSLEMVFVKLQFVLFALGYFYLWKNEGVAGLIFVSCFILMFGMTVWISTILHRETGCAIVMEFPLLVIGLFCLASWNEQRRATLRT